MAFLAAFALYLFTLCPTVWVGDSGELTAAAHVLGIPHPTGYPLWLLLAKAFSVVVPIGTVSWRLNLFSALCAAAAAQLLCASLRRMGCSRLASFAGALSFALLGPIWGEATVARTYPLAALCSASLWWCTARFLGEKASGGTSGAAGASSTADRDRAPRWIVLHSLLLGVGLANHPMVIAHAPALLLLIVARRRELLLRPKLIAAALLALLPGLALYGYLPWRAAADPPIEARVGIVEGDKQRIGELEEPRALLSYLRREAHHERRFAESIGDHVTIVAHQLGEAAREWGVVGVPLLLMGAWTLLRRGQKALLAAVAVIWAVNLAPLALHGAWWDLFLYSRYLTCGWLATALLVGFGLDALLCAARESTRLPSSLRGAAASFALALLLPAALLVRNFTLCDRREAWLAEDYARALLAELPEGAQYIGSGDVALYPLLALRYAEGVRPDLSIVSRGQLKGEADLVLAKQAAKRGEPMPPTLRPLYSADLMAGVQEGLVAQRRGLLWQLVLPLPNGAAPPPAPRAPFSAPKIRGLERDERDPFARSVIGAIEADLADAAAVRGDRAQARARLQRVVQLRCPRPWGATTGVETLLALARDAQQWAGAAAKRGEPFAPLCAQAREDLALAAELARVALECGDARETLPRLQAQQIDGWQGMVDALEFQVSDPPRGVQGLLRAAEGLGRADVAMSAVAALVRIGQRKQAEEALARYLDRFPASAELAQLARELGVAHVKGASAR